MTLKKANNKHIQRCGQIMWC
ncbi:unnamed protein product [Spirodela intermedia]|uniref:Uncharacterized protein n=1 Tax=Spirodela intermedia TaxID=51605 RepID=A0A7I8IMD1_SPIIN|nr:unnamed protein product [Spirodela intermedia]CAA6659028.1 unnamed protein product [Spirodela intermedia]